jgi:hypothetical protein
MFVLLDKLADEKRGACCAVAFATAGFFTEPKNVCMRSDNQQTLP